MRRAEGCPPEGRWGIPPGRRFNQGIERLHQPGVFLCHFLPATSDFSETRNLQRAFAMSQFPEPGVDGPAGDSGSFPNKGDAPTTQGLGFCGGPSPPRPLIEEGVKMPRLPANRSD